MERQRLWGLVALGSQGIMWVVDILNRALLIEYNGLYSLLFVPPKFYFVSQKQYRQTRLKRRSRKS